MATGPQQLAVSSAPDFSLVNAALADVSVSVYQGKKELMNIVPGLGTLAFPLPCHDSARQKKLTMSLRWQASLPERWS